MPSDASKLVHKYVDEVINGKSSRPIGELERLAVERYLRDRDQAKSKGFKLDEVASWPIQCDPVQRQGSVKAIPVDGVAGPS